MTRIIGIDLGTTNSCVAIADAQGHPRVLPASDGSRITPSYVSFTSTGVLTGAQAQRQAITQAETTIQGAKRLIGRKVNAPEVSWFARVAPYRIVPAANGDAWIRIGQDRTSPQEVASHILRRLREIAEQALGEPVTRAVITVPAYFDDHQRQATRDAGTIAGLEVVRILNEPTAAALAYGAHRGREGRRTIAVFDLGGGTFDVSLMTVDHGIFEVLATGGDTALGGADWDRRLLEQLATEIFEQHGLDLLHDPMSLARLAEAAEQCKIALSADTHYTIALPFLGNAGAAGTINFERTVSREEFETLTGDLVERLAVPCERALREAECSRDGIEEILLVGGMTRWPAVIRLVEQAFGKVPSRGANPDEIVALGAAAYAGILSGDVNDTALLDVTPHDLGIKIGSSAFSVVIPRNSMLPVRSRKIFATAHDDQDHVTVEIYQGGSSDISENRKLGTVILDDLPAGPAGSVRVELTLTVDVESILKVTAREPITKRESRLTLRAAGGLSHEEIVDIIARRRQEERHLR